MDRTFIYKYGGVEYIRKGKHKRRTGYTIDCSSTRPTLKKTIISGFDP